MSEQPEYIHKGPIRIGVAIIGDLCVYNERGTQVIREVTRADKDGFECRSLGEERNPTYISYGQDLSEVALIRGQGRLEIFTGSETTDPQQGTLDLEEQQRR